MMFVTFTNGVPDDGDVYAEFLRAAVAIDADAALRAILATDVMLAFPIPRRVFGAYCRTFPLAEDAKSAITESIPAYAFLAILMTEPGPRYWRRLRTNLRRELTASLREQYGQPVDGAAPNWERLESESQIEPDDAILDRRIEWLYETLPLLRPADARAIEAQLAFYRGERPALSNAERQAKHRGMKALREHVDASRDRDESQ